MPPASGGPGCRGGVCPGRVGAAGVVPGVSRRTDLGPVTYAWSRLRTALILAAYGLVAAYDLICAAYDLGAMAPADRPCVAVG